MQKNKMETVDQWGSRQFRQVVLLTAFAILLTRSITALLAPGYLYDQNTFTLWGLRMAQLPANEFYADGYFADYPPGYLWVLKLVGMVLLHWNIPVNSAMAGLILAVPVIIGEAFLGGLMAYTALKYGGDKKAILLFAVVGVCNFSLWFNTGVWKQIDAVFSLILVGSFLLLANKKYLWAAFCYGVALAVKPQALMFGPVLAIAFLLPCFNQGMRKRQIGIIAEGIVVSILPVWVSAIPFWGLWESIPKLFEKYFTTTKGYPHATINAGNLMAVLGANWAPWDNKFLLLSWKTWGTLAILAITLWAAWTAWIDWKKGSFCPLLLASVYGAAVFSFGHAMHERYMVFGAILVLVTAAKWKDKWLLAAGIGFVITSFFNQLLVYMVVDTPHQFLNEGFWGLSLQLIGAVTVILTGLLAKRATDLLTKQRNPIWLFSMEASPAQHSGFRAIPKKKVHNFRWKDKPEQQPKFTPKEIAALCGATAVLAAFSFWYLGDTKAPQTILDSQQGQITTFTATTEGQPASLWVYPGISYGGSLTVADEKGNVLLKKELNHASCFQWSSYVLPQNGNTYSIRLENAQLIELAFKDTQGNVISTQSEQPLVFDEAHLVPQTISQLNSMYFDEIYHGRTGFEFLHRLPVYENTHPPLGKDLIALGIAAFGMTAFGWRFFGTLCGVLMMPVLYLLVRRLSKSRELAAFAAALTALDFMRYSQSRIATIDSYVVLFILLSAFFMVWYCQSVLEKGVLKSFLPMALCGAAFGLGAAAKWTGLYAGAGLAVVYFVVLYLRYRQNCKGFQREFWAAMVGGVVFFVLIPFGIYLASYLPYFLREPNFGLQEWWQCQVSMFEYHSTLQSTHPYESPWFSWPFDARPVWYYYNGENGAYSSISGMINPVVCWLSTAAVAYTLVQIIRKKATRAQIVTLAFFAAQLLPWVLVTRCTFLYHYFPSLGFAIALLALAVQQVAKGSIQKQRWLCGAITAAAAVLLIWFFPAISGLPVGAAWAKSLKWFSSWFFYPV